MQYSLNLTFTNLKNQSNPMYSKLPISEAWPIRANTSLSIDDDDLSHPTSQGTDICFLFVPLRVLGNLGPA